MRELDVIALRADSGRWPAGTEGTILELHDDAALVEISNASGHTEDLLTLPLDALRVTWTSPKRQLGV